MKEIQPFLSALELRLKYKDTFIPVFTITPSKFGAIKIYKLQIYKRNKEDTSVLVTVSIGGNLYTESEEEIRIRIVKEAIQKMLEIYGI